MSVYASRKSADGMQSVYVAQSELLEKKGQAVLITSVTCGYISAYLPIESLRALAADLIAEADRLETLKADQSNG